MARAVAEAAEMTRLLELEKRASELRNDDTATSTTTPERVEPAPEDNIRVSSSRPRYPSSSTQSSRFSLSTI